MVFQKSNPLPKSIFENVVYGLRIAGIRNKATLDEACERSLTGRGALGRGEGPAARERPVALGRTAAAAVHRARDRHRAGDRPDGRALLGARSDRDAEGRRADLSALKTQFTIVIVTHNLQQAARVSDKTAFFWLGKLIEYSQTEEIFTNPKEKHTNDYMTGRFG